MEIETIITAVIGAISGGGIGGLVGWGARKRQENAEAKKKEQEAKGDQIENIEKMVERAYKPIIEDLTARVQTLQEKVDKMDKERDALNERIDELEAENRKLRSALRELAPDSIPSRRGENGRTQPRSGDGRFARKEAAGDGDDQ